MNKNIEINIFQLFVKVWSKKFLLLFVGIFLAIISYIYSAFIASPKYYSTTRIYAINKAIDMYKPLTTQDLQASSFLANDYKEIITSNEVFKEVIEKEDINVSSGELANKISINIPANTRIISITVWDNNPRMAAELANSIRDVSIDKIKEVMKIEDVTILEKAKIPEKPLSPNIKKNVLIGFIVGVILSMLFIIFVELFDDRIKSSEDVEDVLDLPLLGVVPKFKK